MGFTLFRFDGFAFTSFPADRLKSTFLDGSLDILRLFDSLLVVEVVFTRFLSFFTFGITMGVVVVDKFAVGKQEDSEEDCATTTVDVVGGMMVVFTTSLMLLSIKSATMS